MKPDVSIVGWGHTPFGKLDNTDPEKLMLESGVQALSSANIVAKDVDAIFVGTMNNGFSKQDFYAAIAGAAIPDLAGKPAVRLENACATGSAAIHAALDFIAAGRGDVALVMGVEQMNARLPADVSDILLGACYRKEEAAGEAGFAGVFSGVAKAYFGRYGDRSEELAMIAAKNHRHGLANPYAHMRRDLSVEFCNTVSAKNPYVADPLRRTDCSPISDGAAAVVLRRGSGGTGRPYVRFRSVSHVNDALRLSQRDLGFFQGAAKAWQVALSDSEVDIFDLDFVELHDCFTIAELMQYEAMGITAPGRAHEFVRSGQGQKGGRLPINPSGGLKSRGHPIGATGVSAHVMACLQLCEQAGDMQVQGAHLGGVFNMGGVAVANYVSILEAGR